MVMQASGPRIGMTTTGAINRSPPWNQTDTSIHPVG
jgi:hypothetical protein